MKNKILNGLSALIASKSLEEKVNLQAQVSHLIVQAAFDLPNKEIKTLKAAITDCIKNFVDAPSDFLYHKITRYLVVIDAKVMN